MGIARLGVAMRVWPSRIELAVVGVSLSTAMLIACSDAPVLPSAAFHTAREHSAPADREWRTYLGDPSVSHSSPLDEIHRGNVGQLEVAWTYDARDVGPRSTMQCNPIVVRGVLYATSADTRVFALNAATGEELWSFRSAEPNRSQNRGVSYWSAGDDERILFTQSDKLYALDARTGIPIASFGSGGSVDLRSGLGKRAKEGARLVVTTPGSVFEDLLILGSSTSEGRAAALGDVRAYDIRTGEVRWTFHTIPVNGTPGSETWPENARQNFGAANSWAGVSVDVERAIAFIPTGSAAFDLYGGDRPGDNLFANSLIAVDARTGERIWHYQIVRHDLWDRDLPSPPNLVTVKRDGKTIPGVAQTTKSGQVFLFHRETGEPLSEITESEVVGAAVSGERAARSQPVSLAIPPFARQVFNEEAVTRRTPEAHRAVLDELRRMRSGALYMPPSLEGTVLQPGLDGGAQWGGSAFDTETGFLYVNANEVPSIIQLANVKDLGSVSGKSSAQRRYLAACSHCHGADGRGDGGAVLSLIGVTDRLGFLEAYRVVRDGRGRMPAFGEWLGWYEIAVLTAYANQAAEDVVTPETHSPPDGREGGYVNVGFRNFVDPDGFPASRPPWGTLTAIDLNREIIVWRLPLGDLPWSLELGLHGLGARNYGGPVITEGGLLFIAATPDSKFRAFDKMNGELLWESELPAAGFATPSTYEAGGRQFIVVAAGGGKLRQPSGSQYVAYALPAASAR